jgi:GGDEF domain-containing protein
MSEDGEDAKAAAARRSLALLNAQADVVRAELAGLRRDLAKAKDELSGLRTAQLLEANAELVQAAVHADSVAQTAVSTLDELARSTQHDELTGAPTRALMLDRLENAIAMAQRRSTRVGVIFLDLDHFKQINDSLGHAIGDRVLQLATRRLEASVRESDSVSRHGGDEFVVLLAEMAKASDAAAVAQ